MDKKWRQKVEEIIGGINCPKGFPCVESDFTRICRAMDIGRESYLACFEATPEDCPFSFHIANTWYCKCPLRIYISKNLKID